MRKRKKETKKRNHSNSTHFSLPMGIEARYANTAGIVHAISCGMERLAHVEYTLSTTNGQKRSCAVDYYIKCGRTLLPEVLGNCIDAVFERKISMHLRVPEGFESDVNAIRCLVATDIREHLGGRYQPEVQPDLATKVDIVPRIHPPVPVARGVVEIKNATKQALKSACQYDLHVDLSKGCIAATTPDLCTATEAKCRYCYGIANSAGAHIIRSIDSQDMHSQLQRIRAKRHPEGKQTKVICIGNKTDPGHKLYRDELIALLDFCITEGLIPVVRSKFLEYDRKVASRLKKAGGTLVVSLGNDSMEPGTIAHGRQQAIRIADGLSYLRDGVNVVAGIVLDPAQVDGGPLFSPALQVATAMFPKVILYALRAKGKKLAGELFGEDFENRIAPDGSPLYERHGSQYVAAHVHSSILNVISTNNGPVRLCMKSTAGTFCGACHIPGKKGLVIKGGMRKASRAPNGARRRRSI
jgi:hypothetical protein